MQNVSITKCFFQIYSQLTRIFLKNRMFLRNFPAYFLTFKRYFVKMRLKLSLILKIESY